MDIPFEADDFGFESDYSEDESNELDEQQREDHDDDLFYLDGGLGYEGELIDDPD